MKKLSLLVLLCLVLASVPMFAAEPDGKNVIIGSSVLNDTSDYYRSASQGSRTYNDVDIRVGDQKANLKLPIKALIPCYLEFTFTGNGVNVTMQSFGRDSETDATHPNSFIAFYPVVGGFIDENWETIENSTSIHAEVAPGPDVYIRGCDTFIAEVWANLAWNYGVNLVNAEGLKMGDSSPLPVELRYALGDAQPDFDSAAGWDDQITLSSTREVIAEGDATEGEKIWQQFRVPYSREFQAGHYTGEILFTAATI
jgi:hypothetical protein